MLRKMGICVVSSVEIPKATWTWCWAPAVGVPAGAEVAQKDLEVLPASASFCEALTWRDTFVHLNIRIKSQGLQGVS